jgi:hypothetical protein
MKGGTYSDKNKPNYERYYYYINHSMTIRYMNLLNEEKIFRQASLRTL